MPARKARTCLQANQAAYPASCIVPAKQYEGSIPLPDRGRRAEAAASAGDLHRLEIAGRRGHTCRCQRAASGELAMAVAEKRRWLILVTVLMATFMAILDVAIVNVAIPSIRASLGASFGEVELVVTAYTLTYACLLVTGG